MSNDKPTSKPPSDVTWPTPAGPLRTEAEYLRQQAANAQAALWRLACEAPGRIEHSTHLDEYVAEHPFLTTGSAATIGFGVGALLGSRRRNGAPPATARRGDPRKAGGFAAALQAPLLEVFQAVIASVVLGVLSAKHPADSGDGDGGER